MAKIKTSFKFNHKLDTNKKKKKVLKFLLFIGFTRSKYFIFIFIFIFFKFSLDDTQQVYLKTNAGQFFLFYLKHPIINNLPTD
jgi:hypothetical protein